MATTLLSASSLGAFTSTVTPTCDYPAEGDVRLDVVYGDGAFTGNLVLPPEDDVLLDVGYGTLGTEFVGTLQVPVPPDPAAPVSGMSPFAAIALAVKNRLITMTGLDPAWVLLVANDDYKITVDEDFFIYVRFYGIASPRDPALDFTNSGAGRLSRPVARRMRVYVYTRSGVDTYGDDTIALMGNDPSQTGVTTPTFPGQFVAEEFVWNALDDWTPLSADELPLTLTPIHSIDASEEPQRKAENEAGLIRSCLDWEVVYQLCQDPTEPGPQVT